MTTPAEASRYAADVALLDGTSARIRAIRPDDKHFLVEGLEQLSQRSTRLRFFTPKKRLTAEELRYFTELDFASHVALVALIEEAERQIPIGIGRYIVDAGSTPRSAEVAFTVLDRHQGRGVATLLLHHLAHIARTANIACFTAVVLTENRDMLDVFEHSGYPQQYTSDGDEMRVTLDIALGSAHPE